MLKSLWIQADEALSDTSTREAFQVYCHSLGNVYYSRIPTSYCMLFFCLLYYPEAQCLVIVGRHHMYVVRGSSRSRQVFTRLACVLLLLSKDKNSNWHFDFPPIWLARFPFNCGSNFNWISRKLAKQNDVQMCIYIHYSVWILTVGLLIGGTNSLIRFMPEIGFAVKKSSCHFLNNGKCDGGMAFLSCINLRNHSSPHSWCFCPFSGAETP